MRAGGYRLVLPDPWIRIPLDGDLEHTVRLLMKDVLQEAPKELPPDQVLPIRRRAEAHLLQTLTSARDASGIDAYLPAGLMHGNRLNASFVVSCAIPDAMIDEDMAARVMASLLTSHDTRAVTIDDTTWARREHDVSSRTAPRGSVPEPAVLLRHRPPRRVEYRAPVPGDVRRWMSVVFTTAGDGDLDSAVTGVIVHLFDAIMSTWRWSPDEPALMVGGPGE